MWSENHQSIRVRLSCMFAPEIKVDASKVDIQTPPARQHSMIISIFGSGFRVHRFRPPCPYGEGVVHASAYRKSTTAAERKGNNLRDSPSLTWKPRSDLVLTRILYSKSLENKKNTTSVANRNQHGYHVSACQPRGHTACEPRGNNSEGFEEFDLKAKARSWPQMSFMCHIRSTADHATVSI